jgi:hypothetical protein
MASTRLLLAVAFLLTGLRSTAPSVAADHEVHCVDDPVCYGECQVERVRLLLANEVHLPVCYYDQS